MGRKRLYKFDKETQTMIEVRVSAAPEFHYVQDDSMDPVFSHVDRKMYDSKSAMRASYKANGARELGNVSMEDIRRERQECDRQLDAKMEKQVERALRDVVTQGPASWERILGHD